LIRHVPLMSVFSIVLLTLVGAVVLADAAADEWKAPARAAKRKNPIAADEKSIATGKALYVQNCLSCHGEKGKGDGTAAKDLEKKPGDLSAAKMLEQTDGALFWKITEGRKPMPTFEKTLTEENRWTVINYVRTLGPKPAAPASQSAVPDLH
jgi:mono/diheme cytochrome c family protein